MSGTQRTCEEIEQIVRIYLQKGFRSRLRPAQWQALRFFASNPGARLTDFAAYHRSTLGTVSMTVSQLVERGYLDRGDPSAKRNVGLAVTDAGRAMLEDDPMHEVVNSLQGLSECDVAVLHASLVRLREAIETEVEEDRTA